MHILSAKEKSMRFPIRTSNQEPESLQEFRLEIIALRAEVKRLRATVDNLVRLAYGRF